MGFRSQVPGRFARLGLVAIAFLAVSGFGSGERIFAPSSDLRERWTAHDEGSTAEVDNSAWNGFLARYLVVADRGPNLVRYGAVTADDKAAVARYVDAMAALPISRYRRDAQKAYWINLYNALTVKVVLDRYPVESIRDIDISPGLFSDGPWGAKLIEVEGEKLSLNDIEHRILRPIWHDPRVHYAVNCASFGCPSLAPRAYHAKDLDASLDAAARRYINDPRGVEVRGNEIVVSKIYDWFIEDFGDSPEGVLAHLERYADDDLKQRLRGIGKLDQVQYDWTLNDAAPTP